MCKDKTLMILNARANNEIRLIAITQCMIKHSINENKLTDAMLCRKGNFLILILHKNHII